MHSITVAPVRKQIRVRADPARAFELFTAGMGRWWPRHHSINRASPIAAVIVEPFAGGRWLEVGEDGSECPWGQVLVWEPPARLVLAWQIDPTFTYDQRVVTELEVRFTPDGDGTRVDLEHRLDGYGADAERMRAIFDGPQAWQDTLERFAREAG